MYMLNDSTSITLYGDWFTQNLQTDWIANNVFKSSEIELGINIENNCEFIYQYNNILIKPSRNQILFMLKTANNSEISTLNEYARNFITAPPKPEIKRIKLNTCYGEKNNTILPEIFDSIDDNDKFAEIGAIINSTRIIRNIDYEGKSYVLDYLLDKELSKITITEMVNIDRDNTIIEELDINKFISKSENILKSLGYEIEQEN